VAILHAGVVIATHAQLQKCWFFSGWRSGDAAAELTTEIEGHRAAGPGPLVTETCYLYI